MQVTVCFLDRPMMHVHTYVYTIYDYVRASAGLFDSKTGRTDKIHRDNFAEGKRYGDMIKNLEKYPFRCESQFRAYFLYAM